MKIERRAHRTLTLALIFAMPIVASARPPSVRPQQGAQTRPVVADAGAARPDASRAQSSGDAGGALRADASAASDANVAPPPGGPTVNRALSAAQVVAGVQAFYNRTTSFEADFRQFNTAAVSNTTTESAGHVSFKRPGRMRWEYTRPQGNLVISNGTTLWTYEPASRQVFIANLQQSQLPSALSFLMGTGNLSVDFDARLRTTNVAGYSNFYMVELTPRAPNPSFAKLILFVEPQNYQVAEAAVIDAQNNRNRFQFIGASVRLNTNPADALFQFTVPAGTTVIRP